MEFLQKNVMLLLPLILIQLGLMTGALVSLIRRERERVAGGNKWVWALVIIFVNTLGPIIYFAFGRKD